jgi:hypothetical protein
MKTVESFKRHLKKKQTNVSLFLLAHGQHNGRKFENLKHQGLKESRSHLNTYYT